MTDLAERTESSSGVENEQPVKGEYLITPIPIPQNISLISTSQMVQISIL